MTKIIPLRVMESFEKYGTENAHDKLFKDLLDDENELKEFITQFIGINILEKISSRCNTNKNKKEMQRIINYLLYPILQENTKEMIGKFKIEEEMDMKTAQDYIREEMRELRKEGIKEGINTIIINMIKNKVKIEEIKKYTGLEEKEIEKIVANM